MGAGAAFALDSPEASGDNSFNQGHRSEVKTSARGSRIPYYTFCSVATKILYSIAKNIMSPVRGGILAYVPGDTPISDAIPDVLRSSPRLLCRGLSLKLLLFFLPECSRKVDLNVLVY